MVEATKAFGMIHMEVTFKGYMRNMKGAQEYYNLEQGCFCLFYILDGYMVFQTV